MKALPSLARKEDNAENAFFRLLPGFKSNVTRSPRNPRINACLSPFRSFDFHAIGKYFQKSGPRERPVNGGARRYNGTLSMR